MQVKRQPVPIKISLKHKHVKSLRTPPSRQGPLCKLGHSSSSKDTHIDIESILKRIHKTELSIYRQQISSIKMQRQNEEHYQTKLSSFWSDLLGHLGRPEQQETNGSAYAVSYIKRQAIVANQIARHRSESQKCMNELMEKQLGMVKLYSSARKERKPFASLTK